MSSFSQTLLKFFVLIVSINLAGLWAIIYIQHQNLVKLNALNDKVYLNQDANISPKSPVVIEDLAPIKNSIDELEERVDDVEASVNAQKQTTIRTVSQPSSSKSLKEYTIYLGEGQTSNRDWTTVQATTINIDTSKYQEISAVYFEAALSNIGGEAHAQLIDAETGALLTPSYLSNNTQTATWKSTKFNLLSGTHTYVVQIRSSSSELMTLNGARLRILAQ